MEEPPDANVTVGVEILSLAMNVKVTSSPALANVLLSLLELIDTPLKVGAVVSVVTLVPSVVAVIAVPVLPVLSLNDILKVIEPAVSLASAV